MKIIRRIRKPAPATPAIIGNGIADSVASINVVFVGVVAGDPKSYK